jgi:hypothetical protein
MDQFSSHPLYRRHNIDSAMSSIWAFYKGKFLSFFVIALVMSLVLQYASSMINFKEIQSITDPLVLLEKMKEFLVPFLILSLINLFFATIFQYYVIYNPLSSDNNILICLLKSLKYFIPYLVVIIILAFVGTIAIVLGTLALIIGAFFAALYIMTLYLFILPVMIIEGPNIGNTISRTIKLAHKNFWTNIGWVAVFLIILIVISVLFSAIILLPFTGSFLKSILKPESGQAMADFASKPLFIILSAITGALTFPLIPIFSCVLYFNARVGEEQRQSTAPVNPENDRVRVEDLYAKPYSDDHPDNPDKKI